MRLIQHKKEAYWFYSFLSVFYDKYVNPLFWTEYMRDQSLMLGDFNSPDLKVIDVGSGTGFTTQGIAKHIDAKNISCVDQSPHQMKKARLKPDLANCNFLIGDAENIPFPDNSFDRYVSAGSIEYWPDPQRGIHEAMRVIKPGGKALMIGPLEPGNRVGRFIANSWMLFPTLEQYKEWFANAGFIHIEMKFIRPHWFRGSSEYGVAIAGIKPELLAVPKQMAEIVDEKMSFGRWLKMIWRVIVGSLAGFIFIPVALFGYFISLFRKNKNQPENYKQKLNKYQSAALVVVLILIVLIIWLVMR